VENQVLVFIEGEFLLPEQAQLPGLLYLIEPAGYAIGINRLGQLPFKTKNEGLVRAMTLTGCPQGAIEDDLEAGKLHGMAGIQQAPGKHAGSPHRSDGVRA